MCSNSAVFLLVEMICAAKQQQRCNASPVPRIMAVHLRVSRARFVVLYDQSSYKTVTLFQRVSHISTIESLSKIGMLIPGREGTKWYKCWMVIQTTQHNHKLLFKPYHMTCQDQHCLITSWRTTWLGKTGASFSNLFVCFQIQGLPWNRPD